MLLTEDDITDIYSFYDFISTCSDESCQYKSIEEFAGTMYNELSTDIISRKIKVPVIIMAKIK